MATKVKSKQKKSQQEADDLDILHPERSFTLAGKDVVVKEYGFLQSLKLRPVAAPFLDALAEFMRDGVPDLEQIIDAIAEHDDIVVQLLSASIDKPEAWISSLGQSDGEYLLFVWWAVNGPFFMRSVQRRLMAEMVAKHPLRHVAAGETSMQPSSPTDTAQSESGNTQSAK